MVLRVEVRAAASFGRTDSNTEGPVAGEGSPPVGWTVLSSIDLVDCHSLVLRGEGGRKIGEAQGHTSRCVSRSDARLGRDAPSRSH
jgi:hypothetical protein